MGAAFSRKLTYLESPDTEKTLDWGESREDGLHFGVCGMRGWRRSMEDTHLAVPDFASGVGLFGVFDGHGGRGVSRFAQKHLPGILRELVAFKECRYADALAEVFLRVDELMLTERGRSEIREFDKKAPGERRPMKVLKSLVRQCAAPALQRLLLGPPPAVPAARVDCEEDVDSSPLPPLLKRPRTSIDPETVEAADAPLPSSPQLGEEHDEVEDEEDETDKETEEYEDEHEEETEQGAEAYDEILEIDGTATEEEIERERDREQEEAFVEFDPGEILTGLRGEPGPEGQGCTAVVCLVVRGTDAQTGATCGAQTGRLVVANAGDSRCVLCCGEEAVAMTEDHKPELPAETARIVNAGGKVISIPGGGMRVEGDLNLSRAMGDFRYKKDANRSPAEQVIIAVPEIRSAELGADARFVLLACDGIWEGFDNADAVRYVLGRLPHARPEEAGQQLADIMGGMCDDTLCPSAAHMAKPGFTGAGMDNMTALAVMLDRAGWDGPSPCQA